MPLVRDVMKLMLSIIFSLTKTEKKMGFSTLTKNIRRLEEGSIGGRFFVILLLNLSTVFVNRSKAAALRTNLSLALKNDLFFI